ncbi:MAG TPA: GvpL/GvpF family gas vesicle protein [Gemmatimonadaceae bacterium]
MLLKRERSEAQALQLCLITGRDGARLPTGDDLAVVEFRDLVAVARRTRFARLEPDDEAIAAYRQTVEAAFACRPVIPAPFGTIFKSRDSLVRWLELHYFTLADALRYLQNRQAARVRVMPARRGEGWDTREYRLREADLEVTAFDSFRVLRREAVAFVPIRTTGRRTEVEAAFLVERDRWGAFTSLVKDEQRRLPDLRFEVTGPWPPYDFVHLELGG